ncbi:hypothetical protein ACOSP7_004226 [Xanthoceras sorbifolium]
MHSREAYMFKEYHEQKLTFKVGESVSVGVDCGVDSASRNVCEEESAKELDVFVDLGNTKDNKVNRNSSHVVGRKLNCVAKRTRSQSVSECTKKKTELGTAGDPFFVNKEDGDLLTEFGDNAK